MIADRAKITSKGQITLPSRLRKRLKVGPGDHIIFVEDRDGNISRGGRSGTFAELRGLLRQKIDNTNNADIEAWVDKARSRALPGRSSNKRRRRR
jgi:AbrB family looped-hinge helix DNA binding protein